MPPPRSFQQDLVGVFGFPVAENPTQAMVEPAFAALGLSWRYLTVEVQPNHLADAVRGALAMNWRGFNCTIPHKIAVIELLDSLSPAAEKIGAVNCVVIRDGRLHGENTDGKGFLQAFQAIRDPAGQRVLVIGAGGAARAIAVELALAGASHLTIANRTARSAEELAALIVERTGVPAIAEVLPPNADFLPAAETDVLVNATSIGLFPDVEARVPVDLSRLHQHAVVCDVIPNPPTTNLLREARQRGLETLDGLGMLVNQGVIGIKLWTGRDPEPRIMRAALEQVFS